MNKTKCLLGIFLLLLFFGCGKKMYTPQTPVSQSAEIDLIPIDSVLNKMSPKSAQLLKRLAASYNMTFSRLMPEDSNLVHLNDTIMKEFIEAKDKKNKMKK